MLYMLTGTAIGLAISSLARTQQQAMLGVFVIASPMIVLSGYAAPVENMPPIVEFIGRADPVRYMLVAARGLFLQDMPLARGAAAGLADGADRAGHAGGGRRGGAARGGMSTAARNGMIMPDRKKAFSIEKAESHGAPRRQ